MERVVSVENVVEIERLSKSYGKQRGVEGVSFCVRGGEIFGFLGPNGAGKSTTIRSMLGFIKYQEGNIKILGMDAKRQLENILRKVGYMPSEAQFYGNMTTKDIILLASKIRGIDCREEADRLCDKLQVNVNKKISELSLGNRKKVSIVCAMQHKPNLFVFDEPTSGLDPLIQNVFFELIHEYVEKGATCLLSTHVLSEVRNHCDRVAIMKEGKLICVDSVENLMKNNAKRVKITYDNSQEEYLYRGDLNQLMKKLANHNISDILIEEPSIEEIFMHYYQGEDKEGVL